jgi:hypothetical protein
MATIRDIQLIPLMTQDEFLEYLEDRSPSMTAIDTFAKTFVARNSTAKFLATLIDAEYVTAQHGFREDFMRHGIYGTKDKWTLLHIAAFEDSIEGARVLLDRGADPNASSGDSYGYSPLHCASSAEMAALLLDRGARVDFRDRHGATPLFNAVFDGVVDRMERLELIKCLVKRGANPKIPRVWPAGNPLAGQSLSMIDAVSKRRDDYSKRVHSIILSA